MTEESKETFKSDLKKLVDLQKIDLRRDALEARVAKMPLEITALDELIKDHQNTYEKHRDQLAENQKERRNLEGEIQLLQEKISKHKTQLYELKSNVQYQAMVQEIEIEEARVRKEEDKILEKMEEGDQCEELVSQSEKTLLTQKTVIDKQKKALEVDLTTTQGQLQKILERRKWATSGVDVDLLAGYHRVQKLRGGTAMAEVRDGFCGGCNVRLRPQAYNDIRSNRSIINCESCNRILFYADQNSPENIQGNSLQDLAGVEI